MARPRVPGQGTQIWNDGRAEGIQVEVPDECEEVRLGLHHDGAVAVLNEMARALVAAVEGPGVPREEPSHTPRKGVASRANEEMGVVRKQGPGVDGEAALLPQGGEPDDEVGAVRVIAEDGSALEAPHHHMVEDLVTGASRGIGRSIALSLADFKVDVAINYLRHRSRAEATAQEIRDRGVRALLVKGNVADPEDVARIFDSIRSEWGGLDILVSNAASGVLRPARELTLHHFDWAMHINAAALLPLTQNLLKMPSDGEKVLVAVSSLGATRAIPNYTAVGASKAALESMVRHLAAEFAPEGLRINAVSAGRVDTDALLHFPNREELLEAAPGARQRAGC